MRPTGAELRINPMDAAYDIKQAAMALAGRAAGDQVRVECSLADWHRGCDQLIGRMDDGRCVIISPSPEVAKGRVRLKLDQTPMFHSAGAGKSN